MWKYFDSQNGLICFDKDFHWSVFCKTIWISEFGETRDIWCHSRKYLNTLLTFIKSIILSGKNFVDFSRNVQNYLLIVQLLKVQLLFCIRNQIKYCRLLQIARLRASVRMWRVSCDGQHTDRLSPSCHHVSNTVLGWHISIVGNFRLRSRTICRVLCCMDLKFKAVKTLGHWAGRGEWFPVTVELDISHLLCFI